MSTAGRGRGYTGRHQNRTQPRPGDVDTTADDLEAVRTLSELSPRSSESKLDVTKTISKMDLTKTLDCRSDVKEDYHKTPPKAPPLSHEDEVVMAELLMVDDTYTPLLVLLEQFLPGEDGIQFNQKLRNFETTISNLCPDEPRLLKAFATFRAAALQNGSTSRKLASVGASFTRQQRQQLLRSTLLNVVMQGTYSRLEVLERASPQYLVNAANLMGDYFAEARLSNGNKVHILAAPLLHYMKALLNSSDIRAHRSLATQLMQNGRELLSVLSQELDELSISIRRRLLQQLPVSIVWLLLSSDLCLNKFLPLPNSLQKFYASHLELAQSDDYSEVNYGSWKNKDEEKFEENLTEQVNLNLSLDENGLRPKLRPILGAGAGLLRQDHGIVSASQDSFDTWTPKGKNRHDLNSWRQNPENEDSEPVFDPTVLPPNLTGITSAQGLVVVPDYPPPNVAFQQPKEHTNYPKDHTNYPNYLQQGDGSYIQNQYSERPAQPYQPCGDGYYQPNERVTPEKNQDGRLQSRTPEKPPRIEKLDTMSIQDREKVVNEIQNTSARRQVDNWRKEKVDLTSNDDRRPRNWTRLSRDNDNEDEPEVERRCSRQEPDEERRGSRQETDKPETDIRGSRSNIRDVRVGNRQNRRESTDSEGKGEKPRRHVTEVPRSHKYWDHDDRCDIDYNS